jgi:hypothetical protein
VQSGDLSSGLDLSQGIGAAAGALPDLFLGDRGVGLADLGLRLEVGLQLLEALVFRRPLDLGQLLLVLALGGQELLMGSLVLGRLFAVLARR